MVWRRRVDNTYSWSQRWQHAVKPDIGSESQFLPTPPAFDALVRGVTVGILLCRLAQKNSNGVATRRSKNFDVYVHSFWQNLRTWQTHTHTQTDRHTDTAWRHRPRLCIASRNKNQTVTSVIRLTYYQGFIQDFISGVVSKNRTGCQTRVYPWLTYLRNYLNAAVYI